MQSSWLKIGSLIFLFSAPVSMLHSMLTSLQFERSQCWCHTDSYGLDKFLGVMKGHDSHRVAGHAKSWNERWKVGIGWPSQRVFASVRAVWKKVRLLVPQWHVLIQQCSNLVIQWIFNRANGHPESTAHERSSAHWRWIQDYQTAGCLCHHRLLLRLCATCLHRLFFATRPKGSSRHGNFGAEVCVVAFHRRFQLRRRETWLWDVCI